ncbi:MAG: hypothetical protein IH983_07155 [Planctomycetes bacterium]|nr:hypothetical protein [Planctomycetota bacterium]
MRWTVVLVLLLVGCEQEAPSSAPSTLEDALAANYYAPWSVEDHGTGVYFISMKGIWYLKDGVATRVVEAEGGEGPP